MLNESLIRPMYHVPRSQVWAGSRGAQEGHVHLHVTRAVEFGRIRRAEGQALCGKRGWYEREPYPEETTCPRCEELLARLKASAAVRGS